MKTFEEQQITKKEEVTDSSNRDYADELLGKYERKIKQVVHGKFKGATDVSFQDREDIVIDVCYAFWQLVYSGKFKGEHREVSIKSCISNIATNKKNDFLKKFIPRKKLMAYPPPLKKQEDSPDDEDISDCMPWLKDHAWRNPARELEGKEAKGFIERETKYPEIIDSYGKGYSIQVIARIYGLNDEQVKKRIQREKKRLAKIAKQQGWNY